MLYVNHQDILTITPCFMVLNEVFTHDECQAVIEIGKNNSLEESKILGSHDDFNINKNIRQSKSCFIHPSNESAWIFDKLFHASTFINDRYFHFELNGFNAIQYTEYHQGGDHYDWHLDLPLRGGDNEPPKVESRLRKLSASLILSQQTDYIGGELYIDRKTDGTPLWQVTQTVGSIVFFPSFVAHKVNTVSKGTRKSLVFWIEGPKFK